MFQKYRLFFFILIILVVGFLLWFYVSIVVYILIAAVLSIIGQPIVQFFDKIKIPHVLGAFLTLLLLIAIFLSLFSIFVPLFIQEAGIISNLDFKSIGQGFQEPLQQLREILVRYKIMENNETMAQYLDQRMESLVSIATFSGIIKHIFGATGTFIVGVFSVSFITLFFLKDKYMFNNIVLSLVQNKYHEQVNNILYKTKGLLQRYFIGLICDIILMMTLISIAMTIFGVHSPLLIGFFAGLAVIIPYIGPLIGATIAVIIGVTGALSVDVHTVILPLVLKILAIYFVININDGLVFQPLIYGKSVKASPLEIFLILLISGTTAGITGMIVAIPVYTFIRIIAKEFLYQYNAVKDLTEGL